MTFRCVECNLPAGQEHSTSYFEINSKVYCGWDCINEGLKVKQSAQAPLSDKANKGNAGKNKVSKKVPKQKKRSK